MASVAVMLIRGRPGSPANWPSASTTQARRSVPPWQRPNYSGFDKTDQHKTDVTIINKPLPYPDQKNLK